MRVSFGGDIQQPLRTNILPLRDPNPTELLRRLIENLFCAIPRLVIGFRQDGTDGQAEFGNPALWCRRVAHPFHKLRRGRQWFPPKHENIHIRRQRRNCCVRPAAAIHRNARLLPATNFRIGALKLVEFAQMVEGFRFSPDPT